MTESWLKISVVLIQQLAILLRKRSNFLRNFSAVKMIPRRHEKRANAHQIWDISVRQLDSWQKYNHESLSSNLKSPKAWLRLSTPIEYKCSAYFVATKQTILIASKNNQLLFQQATVIVMLKVQKRQKVKLCGSDWRKWSKRKKRFCWMSRFYSPICII